MPLNYIIVGVIVFGWSWAIFSIMILFNWFLDQKQYFHYQWEVPICTTHDTALYKCAFITLLCDQSVTSTARKGDRKVKASIMSRTVLLLLLGCWLCASFCTGMLFCVDELIKLTCCNYINNSILLTYFSWCMAFKTEVVGWVLLGIIWCFVKDEEIWCLVSLYLFNLYSSVKLHHSEATMFTC